MAKETQIQFLTIQVTKLLEKAESLTAQNKQLAARLNAEKNISAQLIDKLRQLENQVETMSLLKSTVETSGGQKNARTRINNMIKEIDRAIAILSK